MRDQYSMTPIFNYILCCHNQLFDFRVKYEHAIVNIQKIAVDLENSTQIALLAQIKILNEIQFGKLELVQQSIEKVLEELTGRKVDK